MRGHQRERWSAVGGVVVGRLLHVIPVLLLVSFMTMLMVDLVPGDPAYEILGEQATPEQVAQVHEELGLNDPLPVRYWNWLSDAAHGDFGTSFRTGQDVWDAIAQRIPVTIELAVVALTISLVVSLLLGTYCAFRADSRVDRLGQVVTALLISAPSFLTALILVYLFAMRWKVFPVTGWTYLSDSVTENLRSVMLPALTLAVGEIAVFTRLLRSDMIATLQEDYILTARSKGLSSRYILFRHALKPSSFSLVTLAGLALGRLIGGAVIVEFVFALPGLGQLLVQSILTKDLVIVQAVVMFVAVAYVVLNTVVDLIYAYLDPRIRAPAQA